MKLLASAKTGAIPPQLSRNFATVARLIVPFAGCPRLFHGWVSSSIVVEQAARGLPEKE